MNNTSYVPVQSRVIAYMHHLIIWCVYDLIAFLKWENSKMNSPSDAWISLKFVYDITTQCIQDNHYTIVINIY